MSDRLTLKWGTLRAWNCESPAAREAPQRYRDAVAVADVPQRYRDAVAVADVPCWRFVAWMNRNHRGLYAAAWPCWSWRINGVLVTLWLASGIVKIYHDRGRRTVCFPAETERCREAIHEIVNAKLTHGGPTNE